MYVHGMGPCGMNGFQIGQPIHFNNFIFNNLSNHIIFDKDQRLHRLVFGINGYILQSILVHFP